MEIVFTNEAKKDLQFWRENNNEKILKRIRELLESIIEMPFKGKGKPEALKHGLSGKWSRRINQQHRIIYEIGVNKIVVHSVKGHY